MKKPVKILLACAAVTLATLFIASFFLALHRDYGTDLATGRSFLRYFIGLPADWDNLDAVLHRGLTVYQEWEEPLPCYVSYQLGGGEFAPIYHHGYIRTWRGTGNWDNFWTNYDGSMALLQSGHLTRDEAQELHRAMLDIYHARLPYEEERNALRALKERYSTPEAGTD